MIGSLQLLFLVEGCSFGDGGVEVEVGFEDGGVVDGILKQG